MTVEGQKRGVCESELLGRVTAADEQAQEASVSAEASLKERSAVNQEVASVAVQLSAASLTSSIETELKFVSPREELAAVNAKIGELRAEMQTGRYQLAYNRRRASDQSYRAVDDRLKSQSSHRGEMLVWKERVEGLESKVSAAVDAGAQTRESNMELTVRLAVENTRRSLLNDARARVIANMDVLGTGFESIVMRLVDVID